MAEGWFKLYADLPDNPRLRALPASTQIAFVWLLCLASRRFWEKNPHDFTTMAWTLRLAGREKDNFQRDVARLMEAGFVDDSGKPKNWEVRQGQALTPAERKRRQRDKERNQIVTAAELSRDSHVTVTPRAREDSDSDIESIPLSPLEAEDRDFEAFWAVYPKRYGKGRARRSFHRLAGEGRLPPISALVEAVRRQAAAPVWQEEGGRFVPAPASWLDEEHWTDELPGEEPAKKSGAPPDRPPMRAASLDDVSDLEES